MLSSDILTEFRGRSDEIRVHPLSFAEYLSAVAGDKNEAFDDYAFYGGMPLVLSRPNDTPKMNYLKSLFTEVYIKDIIERMRIERQDVLEEILDLLCPSGGSLTNPSKIANTLKSKQGVARQTILWVESGRTEFPKALHLPEGFGELCPKSGDSIRERTGIPLPQG